MKLVRVQTRSKIFPGLIDNIGVVRDVSSIIEDVSGPALSDTALDLLRDADLSALPVVENAEFAACVGDVGKVICVGLNYVDHASEAGFEAPEEPILFMKAASSLCGPQDDIIPPIGASKLDYEIELGVVIGTRAKNVEKAQALEHVAGYCVFNDVSERAFQLEGTGQWVKGKSADTFGPCGPWLVTRDEVQDVQNLSLRLTVNGQVRQQASTGDMIFPVAELVAYISRFMTLEPGDVIASGTPPGVGLGMDPPNYLQTGDVVELEIDMLGRQSSTIAK